MTVPADVINALRSKHLPVTENISLASLGSFQLGGSAAAVVTARSPEDMGHIQTVLKDLGVSALLIGEGTNILFSDSGWSGLLIRCAGIGLEPEELSDHHVRVPAAMNLEHLVDWAISKRLSGLEPFVGIPGSVGGAVVGNAGAWGVQMADRLHSVSGWTPQGEPFTFTTEECGFDYRDSLLKREGYWVSELVLELVPGDAEKLLSEKSRILAERSARHPEWRSTPCIGSFFKNLAPTSSAGRRQAAGWFLEQAGAKECRVGGAAVFKKHANILIKESDTCRASDVATLAEQLQRKVKDVHDIDLVREVRYLGSFSGESGNGGFW